MGNRLVSSAFRQPKLREGLPQLTLASFSRVRIRVDNDDKGSTRPRGSLSVRPHRCRIPFTNPLLSAPAAAWKGFHSDIVG